MFINQFEENQPIACKILSQSLKNKKLSHAYIIETNNYSKANEFINSFVKDILCNEIEDEREKEKISIQVDKNEYIELKRIVTSALEIKKEQIISLQDEFKNKAVSGTKKIYIIEEANKFNASSANTILKFLEEPEENIIAILVVNNRYSLMDTILSRCQLISLKEDNEKNLSEFIVIDENIDKDDFITNIMNFIIFYEKNKKNTLLFEKREFLNYFNNRDKVISAFEFMKLFYMDLLKYKSSSNIDFFVSYESVLKDLEKNNSQIDIIKKIDIIIKCIDRLTSYVNLNMLLDYFIIETCR